MEHIWSLSLIDLTVKWFTVVIVWKIDLVIQKKMYQLMMYLSCISCSVLNMVLLNLQGFSCRFSKVVILNFQNDKNHIFRVHIDVRLKSIICYEVKLLHFHSLNLVQHLNLLKVINVINCFWFLSKKEVRMFVGQF